MSPSQLPTSETLQELCDGLKSSLQSYSSDCQKIRKCLINQFGYEATDANAFINDIVRSTYGYQQRDS
ncbi:MAG TPA: hypothetical protein DEP13_04505 [Gammaproteobacteria bacterium]|nr:hypothetical protein [Gammaproteobacteria bacterium]